MSLQSTFIAQQFRRWQCGSIFIRLAVVESQKCEVAQNSQKIWTYTSSRSSNVGDFRTNRKRICAFLFVINSKFGPILHRFWDTAIYWLKIRIFRTPLSYGAPAPYVSFGISQLSYREETRVMHGATLWWKCVILPLTVFGWSTRVTDGRTGDVI